MVRRSLPALLTSSAAAALCLLAATPAPARAAGDRALTVEDVARVRQVAAADVSPDGALAAFVRDEPRGADEPNGPSWRRLYVQATNGGPARPFVTGAVRVDEPRFSPDGRHIGFLAKRGDQEHPQVWAIPVDGGEARAVTDHPAAVGSFVWLADGRIAFVAAAGPTQREEAVADKGYAPRFYEEDLDERALWVAPFAFDAAPAAPVRVTEGVSVWQLDADPTRPRVFLGASPRPLVDQMYMAQDVYAVALPPAGAEMAPVAPRRVVDVPGKLGTFRVSPDGERVAYTAAATRADHAPSHVYVVPSGGGAPVDRTPPAFEGHATQVTWWDDDTVLYLADEGVWTTWSLVGVEGDPARRRVRYHAEETGVVADLPRIARRGRRLVFIGHAAHHPRELFVAPRRGAAERLTRSNPWLAERAFGAQEVVRYEARDGTAIEGVLVRPLPPDEPDAGAGARPPLLVDVHGGPEANVENGWLTGYFHPGQVAAGRGYAIFYPNYRGSTGRGTDFAASSFADPAGAEFDDIADGIAYLTRPDGGVADPQRVGLLGGSYGGYAANWFATWHTALVRAVVSFVGVSDLVAKRLLTDIPYEDEYVHMGAPVRESWAKMLERSPIRWAEKSRSAVLLLHGDADPRVHPSQSQELYRALKMVDHPAVRLVFYPGEGHGNRLRSYRLDVSVRTLDWLDWYVRDGKPLDGPLPPLDLSDRYGLDLPEEGGGAPAP